MIEEGGDWDRRNRLKAYEGVYLMSLRQFDKAADLFLETLSTFTSYELFDYNTFIFYAVVTSIVTLPRPKLKEKVSFTLSFLFTLPFVSYLPLFRSSLLQIFYQLFTTIPSSKL